MRQIIDATAIDQWFTGRRRDAQELLPHLVRKLITATVQPGTLVALHIPVGDDIRRPGFDGTVEVTVPTPYVPLGKSVWEMGTNADPKVKADGDFRNRAGDASRESSFVFVTPRAWDGKAQWVAEHEAAGAWGSVRALDNVELAAWLEDAPAVARWLARQMGVESPAIRDLELFSREVEETYGVELSDDLIISGRVDALNEVHAWLKGSESLVRVEGQWSDEAAAFIGAAVRKLPAEEAEFVASRLCFVDSPDALEYLASLSSTHFVVPLNFETARRARALRSPALRLLIPSARTAGLQESGQHVIRLGFVKRRACEDALKAMSTPAQRAERIAVECKGRLNAVLWMIAQEQEAPFPWTSGVAALELVPLVLAGQWKADSEQDRVIVEKLSARPYVEVERTLATWQTPAGPLVRRGPLWDWLAWDFAWIALAPRMEGGVIARFRDVIKSVLSTRDPSLDLEPNQRFAAAVYGKTHPYSAELRSGLVGSLIQFALTDQYGGGTSGQAIADVIVRDLLSSEGSTLKDAWQSLASWLPDFAEAAPRSFITSVQAFRSNPDAVSAMFTGADFFGPNPHVYLLWALERLAWSKEFFTAAVGELVELAAIDPGGRLSNRPDRSLVEIFRPWHPQTSADLSHRLDTLDVLYARHPDILWPVAVALLPSGHEVASPTASPEWRPWKPDKLEAPPTSGYWPFVEGLVRKMMQWARQKPERWNDLIRHYLGFRDAHPELAKELLAALQGIEADQLSNETRVKLTSALREILSWHEEFDDDDYENQSGAADPRLRPLYELHKRFDPDDPLSKYAWLFVGWPRLAKGKKVSHEERERHLHGARVSGLRTIFAALGLDGLFKLSELSDRPDLVGWVSAELDLLSDVEAELLMKTLAVQPTKEHIDARLRMGIGYVSGAVHRKGPSWITHADKLPGIGWTSSMRANFAWGLPATGATWDQVETWGQEVSELYWSRTPVYLVRDPNDAERAVRSLLHANRPYRAIDIADHWLTTGKSQPSDTEQLPVELIRTALKEAPRHDPDAEWFPPGLDMLKYNVENLLAKLEVSNEDLGSLAALEWAWMPVLEYGRRGLKALQRVVSSDPVLFVDLLRAAYRGEGEEEREVTPDEESRARQADKLLRNWRRVPGTVDFAEDTKPDETKKVEGDIRFNPGQINEAELRDWVARARELAKQSGHLRRCDVQIGEVLAYAPHDGTGVWPCVEVRNLIENVASEDLERGVRGQVQIKRGTHSRAPGGGQERALATKFRGFAEKVSPKWPRTGAVLFALADRYDAEAKWQDERTEHEEFE